MLARSAPLSLVLLVICFAIGCASSDKVLDGYHTERDAIQGGVLATDHPEAVLVDIAMDGTTKIARCSGTLILPNLVLTAKHCLTPSVGGVLPDATVASITVRAPYAKAGPVQAVTGRVPAALHPSVDLALIQVDPPIEADVLPSIVPVPLPVVGEDAASVDIIGRRRDDELSDSDLFVATTTARVRSANFYVLPVEAAGHSDSGGPVYLLPDEGGARAITAVISTFVSDTDHSVLVQRIDAALDWFTGKVVAVQSGQALSDVGSPSGSDSCGTLGYYGACNGQTLSYCDANTVHDIDCTAGGGSCVLADGGGYNCLYTGDACGDVTYDGGCNGSTLTYCDGTIQVVDCAAQGLSCTEDPSAGGFNCL